MGVLRKIKDIIWLIKLKRANAYEFPELMRSSFYHLGKNVKLYAPVIGTEPYLISIHDNVTCAYNVHFINHDVSCFNVARYLGLEEVCLDKVGPIELFDNCFIGMNTLLMPNTSVGKNSIVAAGSVVTKHIPDNEVWGGCPARYIMSTEQYAKKLKAQCSLYPWIDSVTLKKNAKEQELIKLRQHYFFEKK